MERRSTASATLIIYTVAVDGVRPASKGVKQAWSSSLFPFLRATTAVWATCSRSFACWGGVVPTQQPHIHVYTDTARVELYTREHQNDLFRNVTLTRGVSQRATGSGREAYLAAMGRPARPPPSISMARADDKVHRDEQRKQNQLRRNLNVSTLNDATRFAEYDFDGDQKLDFEEFLAMQPKKVRETYAGHEIQAWFDAADTDGNGSLSINEFFKWSLSNASLKHGATALEAAFRKYDKDGTGFLDSFEFEQAATEMGFGAVAHDLFKSLDDDGSGSVTYHELIESLTANVPSDSETKKMLTALVWAVDKESKASAEHAVDGKSWKIRGDTAVAVTQSLQALLRQSGGHVADLIKLFDEDAETALLIDDVEFIKAMRNKFGYGGPLHVLQEVFTKLDTDGSGKIGFDELFEVSEDSTPETAPYSTRRRLEICPSACARASVNADCCHH